MSATLDLSPPMEHALETVKTPSSSTLRLAAASANQASFLTELPANQDALPANHGMEPPVYALKALPDTKPAEDAPTIPCRMAPGLAASALTPTRSSLSVTSHADHALLIPNPTLT